MLVGLAAVIGNGLLGGDGDLHLLRGGRSHRLAGFIGDVVVCGDVGLAVYNDGVPGNGHEAAVLVLLHVNEYAGEGVAVSEGAGREDRAVLFIGLAAVAADGLLGGDGDLHRLGSGLLSGLRGRFLGGSGGGIVLGSIFPDGVAAHIAELVMSGNVFLTVLDHGVGGYGHKAVLHFLDPQGDGRDGVPLSQMAAVRVAVGGKTLAILHRGVGGEGDHVDPLALHAAVGIGLEALTGVQFQNASAGVLDLPAGEEQILGIGDRRLGSGEALAGIELLLAAGSAAVVGQGDGQGLFLLQRAQDQHQRVDLGLHGGGGGEEALVKVLALVTDGAGLQEQIGLFRIGGKGQGLPLLGLHGVAPEIAFGNIEALGHLDDQALLHQVLQNGGACCTGQGRFGFLASLTQEGDGAAAAQLVRFFLGGEGSVLALGVGQEQLVYQSLLAGEGHVHIVCQGHAAELEHKDQNQQQAQHHAKILFHGNHLDRKRLLGCLHYKG